MNRVQKVKGELVPLRNVEQSGIDFDSLVDTTLQTIGESSRRVYAETYQDWYAWCEQRSTSPFDFGGVANFLKDQPVSYSSRKRMMSAIRMLVETLMFVDTERAEKWRGVVGLLRRVRTPRDGVSGVERDGIALTPTQANAVLNYWSGDTVKDKRNKALMSLLLATGLRRSEAACLEWRHVDLDRGILHVKRGKGDKDREVAIYGNEAIKALIEWRALQGEDRQCVFCGVNKHDGIGKDSPLSGNMIWRIVKETRDGVGLEQLAPHDMRRTIITELLEIGRPLSEVQAQAGHARGDTTLKYAKSVDAETRRKETKMRYG